MTYTFKTTPRAHQAEALKLSWFQRSFAYLMEMGTGKTKVAIDNIGLLYCDGKINGALVVAPKGVYGNWVHKEIPEHLGDDVQRKTTVVQWTGGGTKRERDALDAICKAPSPGHLHILVMNVEAFSGAGRAYAYAERFLKNHKAFMAVDESTRIKTITADRTKRVIALGRLALYRRIMSGLPTPRSPLDLYGQFDFLDKGSLGFDSWWAFRSRYAVMEKKSFGGRSIQIVVSYRNVDELNKRIAPFSYRKLKEECLDLPPKIYMTRDVELSDEQARLYRELKENSFAELSSQSFVSATEVIVKLLRMHQLVCGHVVDQDGKISSVPEKRMDALFDVLEEAEGSSIIWATYTADIAKIVSELGRRYGAARVAAYYGATSGEARQRSVEAFQSGEATYFVGNAATGGLGITLTRAKNVIYYSNNYDLEQRLQSEDRAHRLGLQHSVNYIDLVTRGTVDEKILEALRKKINLSTAILGDGFKSWLI
jgi:SNF2 family DNA or RNA helicase